MNKPRRKHYRDCSWGKHSHFKPGTHTCKFWKSPGYLLRDPSKIIHLEDDSSIGTFMGSLGCYYTNSSQSNSNGLKKSKIQPLWSMTLQVQLPSGAVSDVVSKGLDVSFPRPWHGSIFLEHVFLRVLLWSHPPCFELRWVLCEGLFPPPFFFLFHPFEVQFFFKTESLYVRDS